MLIAGAPVVAMSPLVEVIVPVLLVASRPRRLASGVMSRSAKVMAPVLLDRSTPSPAGAVDGGVAEVGRDRRTRHQEADAGVVLEVGRAGGERAAAAADDDAVRRRWSTRRW